MDNIGNISMLQIEVFLCVTECRSISEAARKLFISQSAATRWIQKLETAMNIKLFERTNQGIALTEDGERLYVQLKQLYTRMRAVLFSAQSVSAGERSVRVAFFNTNEILEKMSPVLKQYQIKYPDVGLDVSVCEYQELREGILSGRFDCAFTYSVSSKNMPGAEFRYYKHMDTVICVSAQSAAIVNGRLDYAALGSSYLSIQPTTKYDNRGARDMNICRSLGFTPKGIRYATDETAAEILVKDMDCFSIAGPGFGQQYGDRIRRFKVERLLEEEQYIGLLWRPGQCSADTWNFVYSVPSIDPERREENA